MFTLHIWNKRFQIIHTKNNIKTYLFFDNVHVFPPVTFNVQGVVVSSPDGYISWSDLHSIYDQDSKLPGNLRKANKLTYRAMHPGNDKQFVHSALSIFHKNTIVARKSYFPERKEICGFISLIHTWRRIVNSRDRFCSNQLRIADVDVDGNTDFFLSFAEWLNNWS